MEAFVCPSVPFRPSTAPYNSHLPLYCLLAKPGDASMKLPGRAGVLAPLTCSSCRCSRQKQAAMLPGSRVPLYALHGT